MGQQGSSAQFYASCVAESGHSSVSGGSRAQLERLPHAVHFSAAACQLDAPLAQLQCQRVKEGMLWGKWGKERGGRIGSGLCNIFFADT